MIDKGASTKASFVTGSRSLLASCSSWLELNRGVWNAMVQEETGSSRNAVWHMSKMGTKLRTVNTPPF